MSSNAKETSKYDPALLKTTPLAGFPKLLKRQKLYKMQIHGQRA